MQTVPAYNGPDGYAFVCYSHEDAAVVYPELERLQAHGHNIWYDEGISPGHEWTEELSSAIDACAQFLFFVTPRSVQSRNCRNEVQYALTHNKPIVAVYLEQTHLPGGLELSIGSAQAIHRYDLDDDTYWAKVGSALGHPSADAGADSGGQENTRTPRRFYWLAAGVLFIAVLGAFGTWKLLPTDPAGADTTRAVSANTAPPSLAVLPFLNLSSDASQEYFADGVAEELLNLLSANPGLKVISRLSSFSFRGENVRLQEVAQELGVNHILQGSVRKADDSVRIAVQLVDVATDTYRWSKSYDRTLDDIFSVQDEIAQDVASAMDAEFLGGATRRQTVQPEAYTLYLEARHILGLAPNERDYAAVEQKLTRALALEPDYVAALRELGRLRLQQMNAGLIEIDEAEQLRWDLISRALAIDPDDPISNAYRGFQEYTIRDDLQAAARRFEKATALAPTSEDVVRPLYLYLSVLDRYDEALSIAEYVVERNPKCGTCMLSLAHIYYRIGRLEDAERLYLNAQQISNAQELIAHEFGYVRLRTGNYEGALELAGQMRSDNPLRVALEAKALHALGRSSEFEQAMARLFEFDNSLLIAGVYAQTGDAEKAFSWLSKSLIQFPGRSNLILTNATSPDWEAYRDDPRWRDYLDAIGRSPERLAGVEFNPTLPVAVRQRLR